MSPPASARSDSSNSSSSCMVGCLGIAALAFLLMAGVAWWVYQNGREFFTELGRDKIVEAINASGLEAEEKELIAAEIDRVSGAFLRGEIPVQKMVELAEAIAEGPLMSVVLVEVARTRYLDPSGLSEEEKAAGLETLRRAAYGQMEGLLTEEDLDAAFASIEKPGSHDADRRIQETLTDEQLRAFLAEAKAAADRADVPAEVPAFDLVEEFRGLLREILGADMPTSDPAAENAA